jgi:hypothetical protein
MKHLGRVRPRYGDEISRPCSALSPHAVPAAGSTRLVNSSGWRHSSPDFVHHKLGDDNLIHFSSLKTAHQIGICLHLDALAALVGDVELASRVRYRARNREAENRIAREREEPARKRETLETARDRGQAARRARIQARCLVARCRFLLADTARNRLQLSEALAVLIEQLRPMRE